ncbi:MAG: DNA-3-methyladenine glycosylase [Bacteroidota bacterium]
MAKIHKSFYRRQDVVLIAKELLGKHLYTCMDGKLTGGIITETEAYAGITDKASHAYGNRRTQRTEMMYCEGGTAYVYLCYGVHSLFNIVTNLAGTPHAVLVRGIWPVAGQDIMLQRTGKSMITAHFGVGPGNVAKALGIHYSQSGLSLMGNRIWLEDLGLVPSDKEIAIATRIGVAYAGEDAARPYRFIFTKYQKP